jgi:hypothetical protein
MGLMSRRKGARCEREVVDLHRDIGIPAERIPLSGSMGGSYAGDVKVPGVGVAEVKVKANGGGFGMVYRWLEGRELLFMRADRAPWVVAMPWSTYERLIKHKAMP